MQFTETDEDGDKFYFKDQEMNILHCETGPAIEWSNGLAETSPFL